MADANKGSKCCIDGCDKKRYRAKHHCITHHYRITRTGSADLKPRPTLKERFYSRFNLDPDTGCWNWSGFLSKLGYGSIVINKKLVLAHRASYELHKGEIPIGLCVCHTCDNPSCVNPEHLFLGTHKENTQDMIRKGRKNPARGEAHPNAKLTAAQVQEILRDNRPNKEVAKEYNVDRTAIQHIRKRKNWKSVPQ